MTRRLTDDERRALITSDGADHLDAGQEAEVALLADLLADPSTWVQPPAGLEDDVARAVAEADSSPSRDPSITADTSVTPTRPTTDASPTVTPITARASRERTPRRRRIVWSAAAAAAAILIAGAALVTLQGAGGAEYKGQLTATGLAPGAHAAVAINRNGAGFHITLDAHGLPTLPDGQYYQAWLKNSAGTLVPIGTFSSSDGRVTLWSGVSPTAFPTLTVTIEATDGNQASSGRRVLVGTVHPR